ncbi:MAG: tRNA 4-thiouridine(8) synthase ThiI [Candidatus Pacebacteria bacterium]|nr:tRNA 4-thiouridine(8) synthase ThiI [Candidatus Paceibacterota bacterium]
MAEKGMLIAFGEMFLKSKRVKDIFQKKLASNISLFLNKEKLDFNILSFRERIFIKTEDALKVKRVLKGVFGIYWFCDCFYFPKASSEQFLCFIQQNYSKWIKKDESFALRLKVHKGVLDKAEFIDKIAKQIRRKVNLSKPDKEIFIEIRKSGLFLYFKKQKGLSGLPVGSGGRVLSLVSSGIDSPVASYLALKRGLENTWVHFHSFPLVSKRSIDKIEELADIFLNYQPRLKVYFVPFSDIQSEIKTKAPAKYRVLIYRRIMLKIAQQIAEKENCSALSTGDNLGQVSSQTIYNIKIIEEAVEMPILRPLLTYDKEEIIRLAEKIKTFKISIKPQEDCCTLFVPAHQTAKGKIEIIKDIEKELDIDSLVNKAVGKVQIKNY